MATSELDTTPVEWKAVRENLVQLHCEDVSWEQATDKIPLDLVKIFVEHFGIPQGKQVFIHD